MNAALRLMGKEKARIYEGNRDIAGMDAAQGAIELIAF
jgi:hypothetical protein